MKLLNEKYETIKEEEKGKEDSLFWTFDLNKKDFFLKSNKKWINLLSDAYFIKINNNIIKFPVNYYIIIGDYDGGLDTICPYEIVGRDFDAFVINKNFEEESWTLENIQIVGYEQDSNFIIPDMRTVFPIELSEKKCILVSEKEIYNKLKHLLFSDIV